MLPVRYLCEWGESVHAQNGVLGSRSSRLPMLRKALRPIYEAQGILTALSAPPVPTIPAVPDVDRGARRMRV